MDETPGRGSELLSQLKSIIDEWIEIYPTPGVPDSYERRLDVLQRLVELGRLETGHLTNEVTIAALFKAGIQIDSEKKQVTIGAPQVIPGRRPKAEDWDAPSARTPDELQVPLLLYLLQNHRRGARIGDLIADFIRNMRRSLTPFDMESTRTGVPRVATNTRLAAQALREWGLLERSDRFVYKTWELTHLGMLVGSALYMENASKALQPRTLPRSHHGGLVKEIRSICAELTSEARLAELLERICRPHEDVLESLAEIRTILTEFHKNLSAGPGSPDSNEERREGVRVLVEKIKELIPLEDLATDLATGIGLDELLQIRKP